MKPGLTEKDVIQIKEVFDNFSQGRQFLEPQGIRNALYKHGYNATNNTVFHILGEYDKDEDGKWSFDEFVNMCALKHTPKETYNEIRYVQHLI
jgi:Ca2+-binding EF-hand superfamily protein